MPTTTCCSCCTCRWWWHSTYAWKTAEESPGGRLEPWHSKLGAEEAQRNQKNNDPWCCVVVVVGHWYAISGIVYALLCFVLFATDIGSRVKH